MSILDSPALPGGTEPLASLKILVFCTAVNSFTQRVLTQLRDYGFTSVSTCVATDEQVMCDAASRLDPDLVICPFLTRIIPDSVFKKYITLVVHPGPPGDAGPSSLDWALLGDTGLEPDPAVALHTLLSTSHSSEPDPAKRQRSHWGCIVFQANEHLDGGSIWAWDQYPLPPLGTITKAQLYQNQHSNAALHSLITAMVRVYSKIAHAADEDRMSVKPEVQWEKYSLTGNSVFLGGPTHERPLIPAKARRPVWEVHTAADVLRIVNASDSQPGAQLAPLTANSKTCLFAYGAHVHRLVRDVPRTLYTSLGYARWDDIPDGRVIGTRYGATFIKTHQYSPHDAAGVWITHGRIPKKAGSPLEAKVPMEKAIRDGGHGTATEGVQTWKQASFEEAQEGVWQEVWVKTEVVVGGLAQCVSWDFYNGAFSTRQCQTLLAALQWAVAPERGNVKVLALMGGSYFSNGIALNTIESHPSPGEETWANINAIDDIVEFLVSDTHAERSGFMSAVSPGQSLCQRGIVTVACMRGNAAAGGVALAAACDITVAASGLVLNPAYRAMGLHGSEFHSYSYLARCGPTTAATMLRNMLPQSIAESIKTGLVDFSLGSPLSTRAEVHTLALQFVRSLFTMTSSLASRVAPWCRPAAGRPLIDAMAHAKTATYAKRSTPLVHYRNEELSQMLLDSFHPVRSLRYHTRRYKFIRKVKASGTASRYAGDLATGQNDEEELQEFDLVPGWIRGEEWAWAGLERPASLWTSEWTRINLYPGCTPLMQGEERMIQALDFPMPATTDVFVSPKTQPKRIEVVCDPAVEDPPWSAKTIQPGSLELEQGTPFGTEPAPFVEIVEHDATALQQARKDSTTSGASSAGDGSLPSAYASSGECDLGNDSLASADSAQFPLTPPVLSPKSPRTFFTRKSVSGGRPRTATSAAAVFGEVTSTGRKESGQKFKLFSKRLSAALAPKPLTRDYPAPMAPHAEAEVGDGRTLRVEETLTAKMLTPNGSVAERDRSKRLSWNGSLRSMPRSATSTISTPRGQLVVDRPLAQTVGERKRVSPGPIPTYTRPRVDGDDEVEFPCLYDPQAMQMQGRQQGVRT